MYNRDLFDIAAEIRLPNHITNFIRGKNLGFLTTNNADRQAYAQAYAKAKRDPARLDTLNASWVKIILTKLGVKKYGDKFGPNNWEEKLAGLFQALDLIMNLRGPKVQVRVTTRTKMCPVCRHLAQLERVNGGVDSTDISCAHEYYGECSCTHRHEVRAMSVWAVYSSQARGLGFWEQKVRVQPTSEVPNFA